MSRPQIWVCSRSTAELLTAWVYPNPITSPIPTAYSPQGWPFLFTPPGQAPLSSRTVSNLLFIGFYLRPDPQRPLYSMPHQLPFLFLTPAFLFCDDAFFPDPPALRVSPPMFPIFPVTNRLCLLDIMAYGTVCDTPLGLYTSLFSLPCS